MSVTPQQAAPVAAKPETQGERAELIEKLQQAKAAAYRTNSRRLGAILEQAAALLSAGPARVEPLTEEQVEQMRKQWMYGEDHRYSPFVAGLRAGEAAHGIGKDQA
jgi:hypothetical protein